MDTKEQIHAAFGGMNYQQLAEAVKKYQAEIADAKAAEARARNVYDTLTIEIIPDKMAEDGFRSVNLADGGRIQLSPQAYCSTRAGMKNALFQWLLDNDFQDLITEVVNPGTLKSFIKEQLEAGNPVPDDEIVNYQPFTRASVVGK